MESVSEDQLQSSPELIQHHQSEQHIPTISDTTNSNITDSTTHLLTSAFRPDL